MTKVVVAGAIAAGERCPRCHHTAPNPVGCAACNPVELGDRLRAANARLAKLEELLGLLPDSEELATPTVWAQAVSHGTFKVYTTESPSGETLVAVKLPANCTVHSAEHLGIGPAQLARIVEMAVAIAQHWRDQEGVNASLLDELASAVPPDLPKHPGFLKLGVRETPERVRVEPRIVDLTAAFDLKPGDRVRIGDRQTIVDAISMQPAQGVAMLRFTQGWLDDGEQPPSLMPKIEELHRKQWEPIDRAIGELVALGYEPKEMAINRQPVPDLGERTVLALDIGSTNGVEVYEVVTAWPKLPMAADDELKITVTAQWLRRVPGKEKSDG